MARSISKRQNTARNLQRLAAQRLSYDYARRYDTCRFLFGVVLVVLLTLVEVLLPAPRLPVIFEAGRFAALVALVAVIVTFVDIFVWIPRISVLRTKAAIIQEEFDTDVLMLDWNHALVPERTEHEDVFFLAQRHKRRDEKNGKAPYSEFRDWYPAELGQIPIEAARVVAQRTNAWWDYKLRQTYLQIISAITVLVVCVVVVCAFVSNYPVQDLLVILLAPLLPLSVYLSGAISGHKATSEKRKALLNSASNAWDVILAHGFLASEVKHLSRNIQNEIFRSREGSPFVPKWLYWLGKERNEEAVIDSAVEMVAAYLAKHGIAKAEDLGGRS